MGLYPIFVEIAGRACLVVGGGSVAETKVGGLLAGGAQVTIVSPGLTDALAAAARAGRVGHRRRPYQDGDLAGFALAFATTGDPAVNAAVAAEGQRRGVWVNAADDPAHCDFILPAILRRGALAVAVSTGGASPALAGAVRDEIDRHLGDDYVALVDIAGEVRRALRAEHRRVDPRAWRAALADARFRSLVATGRSVAAGRWLRARLEAV